MSLYEHEDYIRARQEWLLIRNLMKNNYKQYILPPDYCTENQIIRGRLSKRNRKYIDLAVYYNFISNTKFGLVGTATLKDPEFVLPPALEYLRERATGTGISLLQLFRKTLGEVVEVGRYVLRTDYPPVSGNATEEEVKAKKPLPYIYEHTAESVVDWAETITTNKPCMVRIRESYTTAKRLSKEYIQQQRLLYLDDNGNYVWELLDSHNGNSMTPPNVVRQNGNLMKNIPITFVGSEDNNPQVDIPPLASLALISVGHLRNSANFEDNLDKHGQGTGILTSSLSKDQWASAYADKEFQLGSGEIYFVGSSGGLQLVQLGPNQLAIVAMEAKINAMVGIGADILMPAHANAPVDTTKMQMGAKLSKLGNYVANTAKGIEDRLKDCGRFLGLSDTEIESIEVNPSYDFIPQSVDPGTLTAMVQAWLAGGTTTDALINYQKKVGIESLEKTNEEIIGELANQSPLGAGQGFNIADNSSILNNSKTNVPPKTDKASITAKIPAKLDGSEVI